MGMSNNKIHEVLNRYEPVLVATLGAEPTTALPHPGRTNPKLRHALGMIAKIRGFLAEDRREKAFRWLGFLQAVLWCHDFYEIEELANHNRPTETRDQDPDGTP